MNIYRVLEQCIKSKKSIEMVVSNKYTAYSFQILYYQDNYYLFLNSKPIDIINFCSYIIALEIFISNDNNLYSDIYLNYEIKSLKDDKTLFLDDNAESLKISPERMLITIKECYQKFCKFNNIFRFQDKFKIEDITQKIYLFLKSSLKDTSMPMVCNTFFSLLANKINENFYHNRQNLIDLFTEAMLNNEEIEVNFNLKGINYTVKFFFTDANNLEATIINFDRNFIGTEAFALLYTLSIFYNEDYETDFIIKKIPREKEKTSRQVLLNAYLLNELINQNKNNSKTLIEIVHNYYKEKGLAQANLLFLIEDIKKVINGDSEFQDYSEDKKTVQMWLKRNAATLLDTDEALKNNQNENANNPSLKKDLTKKPKLIYWPNNDK